MKRILFMSLVGLLAVSTHATAQTTSGNILYESCTSDNQVMNGFCLGYLIGRDEGQFLGALLMSGSAGIDTSAENFNSFANEIFQHCVPSEATNAQLRDVVVQYLRKNPESRHETARFLVLDAYREAFPCR